MIAYTDAIDLSTVPTPLILLWLERLNEIQDSHDPTVLTAAGFTIPATISRLDAELLKLPYKAPYATPTKSTGYLVVAKV